MKRQQCIEIGNMVCARCKTAVARAFAETGWSVTLVELGKVLATPPPKAHDAIGTIRNRLEELGFLWLEPSNLSARVRSAVIEFVYEEDSTLNESLSDRLARKLECSYDHLNRRFRKEEGRTVGKYYLLHRMERARQLLVYTDLPISEIAAALRYTTLAHFSATFKRTVGCSPSAFRNAGRYTAVDLNEL